VQAEGPPFRLVLGRSAVQRIRAELDADALLAARLHSTGGNSELSFSAVFSRVVALVGGAARVSRQLTQGSPGVGRRSHNTGGKAAGQYPNTQDANGPELGRGTDAGRGAGT
jgi:hypothetical protein